MIMHSEKNRTTNHGFLKRVRTIGTKMVGKKPIKENMDINLPESAWAMLKDFVKISGSHASIAKELNAPMLKTIIIAHATDQRPTGSLVLPCSSGFGCTPF